MKRILTIALAFAAVGVMSAQQQALKDAKKLSGKVDKLEDARATIKGAMQNPETSNLAETWFVAGKIEMDAYDALKKNPDSAFEGQGGYMLMNALEYWDKAGELDNPEKPKFMKDIVNKAIGHIDDVWVEASNFYNHHKYYPEAYNLFSMYGDATEGLIPDSIRGNAWFWAGTAAVNSDKVDESVKAFQEARRLGYTTPEAYSYEMAAWQKVKEDDPRYAEACDNIDALAHQGFDIYGLEQPVFISNIINDFVKAEKLDDAAAFLNAQVQNNPNDANVYNLLAFVYGHASKFDDMDKAYRKMAECPNVTSDMLLSAVNMLYQVGASKNNEIDGNSEADRARKKELNEDYVVYGLKLLDRIQEMDPDNKKVQYHRDNLEYLGELLSGKNLQ